MSEYKPLFVYLEPASIPQVVAHIQKYLAENPIISDEETIAELIREYIAAHPELLAVSSVNGKTGNVVLTGSDININASSAVSVETQLLNLASMIQSASGDITQIEAQLETIYTNYNELSGVVDGHTSAISGINTTLEGYGTRLTNVEGAASANTEKNTQQDGRLNDLEGNVSTLSGAVNTLSGNVSTNTGNIETLQTFCNTLSGNVSDIETKLSSMAGTYHVSWAASVSFPIKNGQHALVMDSNLFYTIWRGGGGLVTNYYINTSGDITKVSDMKNIVLNGDTCTISNKSGESSTFNVIVIG